MKLEVLREADYVLNVCGRPVPPPGFKFVDLPRIIPFFIDLSGAPGTPLQYRVANNSTTLFICRGIMIDTQVGIRIKWPSGRFLDQNPSQSLFSRPTFPNGRGSAILALVKPEAIAKDAKIAIELSGFSAGSINIQFWGVVRYLLRESDAIGGRGSALDASCMVGYPTLPTAAPELAMIADPVQELEERDRYFCGPNQNIMAPEFLLGNQCTPETPAGYYDDAFTFFSDPIAVPVDGQNYGNVVLVPGRDDVIIRNVRAIPTFSGGAPTTVIPTFSLRLPNGYSVTGGDQVPISLLFRWPTFPTLRVRGGDRLILDLADILGTGEEGTITTVFEFDGAKRARPQ